MILVRKNNDKSHVIKSSNAGVIGQSTISRFKYLQGHDMQFVGGDFSPDLYVP